MKRFFSLIIVLFLFGTARAADEQRAQPKRSNTDVSLGGLVFYGMWNPVWKKQTFVKGPAFHASQAGEYQLTSWNFIGGPLFSIRNKNGWSVSLSATYGTFKAVFTGVIIPYGPNWIPVFPASNNNLIAQKIDADCIISKNFNQYIKIFFGPKYQGYLFRLKKIDNLAIMYGVPILKSEMSQLYSGGLGLGLGGTIPLGFSFYLLPSASFIAMSGLSTTGEAQTVPLSFGGNAQVLLTYQIDAANLAISVGGKANYLYYYLLPDKSYLNRHDYFYGGVLMLAYTF